jgi:hypothetical protein
MVPSPDDTGASPAIHRAAPLVVRCHRLSLTVSTRPCRPSPRRLCGPCHLLSSTPMAAQTPVQTRRVREAAAIQCPQLVLRPARPASFAARRTAAQIICGLTSPVRIGLHGFGLFVSVGKRCPHIFSDFYFFDILTDYSLWIQSDRHREAFWTEDLELLRLVGRLTLWIYWEGTSTYNSMVFSYI